MVPKTILPLAVLFSALGTNIATAQTAAPYPFGAVISPSGNQVPSREQQQFIYRWAQRAGINMVEHEWAPVADGFLSWDVTQTGPDTFNWKAYDGVVEDAESSGMQTMLEVSTWYCMPQWLIEKHPEILMLTPLGGGDELTPVKRDGTHDINTIGSLADPTMRQLAVSYVRALATRYAKRPGVRGYIIGEERGLPGIWPAGNYYGIDFSPAMRDAYHRHLRQKYGTIGALNRAWNNGGRYKDFKEIVWRRGWAHEPTQYRGEWLEYYRVLQREFAEYHNLLAKVIHEVDPDAKVMVSDFAPLVNRVGHGCYPPLLTEIDEIAYKSYWNDQRMQMDYLRGLSGGKGVWVSNFSEGATTQGTVHRYMESRYVRRAFWSAFSRGLDGAFFWIWSPVQMEKMSLFHPMDDGSIEPLAATLAIQQLGDFMREQWTQLSAFKPAAPQIAVHDPNLTFLAQQWQYADPKPERVKWSNPTPAASRYHKAVDILAAQNRRFTMSTDENLERVLRDPNLQVLCLTGVDHLDDATLKSVTSWIQGNRLTILDNLSGQYTPLGIQRRALDKFHNRPNVLVVQGENWQNDAAQQKRLVEFLNARLPVANPAVQVASGATADISLLEAANGDELAIIVRTGPMGRTVDELAMNVNWKRAHTRFTVLDPFATRSQQVTKLNATAGAKTDLKMAGFQDAILVLAQ